jgi:hypothetical protein
MLNKVLLDTLDNSDCIDDVLNEVGKSLKTVGIWANNKYSNVCNELDEANRIIQELKDELAGNIASKEATSDTVYQLQHENEYLETWYHKYVQLEVKNADLQKQYYDLHVKYEELVRKSTYLVSWSRYDSMLKDYIDLVSKVKDGTALEYIKGLK